MHNRDSIHLYLLSKPATTMDYPFGAEVMVFRVNTKMFATLALGRDKTKHYWLNLKCDPDEAEMLRSIFSSIIPGYHMCKRNWNTVILDGTVPDGEIERMIDNSYHLVISNMAKKEQLKVLSQCNSKNIP